MTSFQLRDPTSPDFWSERLQQNHTPWDRGAVPLALQDYVARHPEPRHVLIPGCGSGHEVAYLSAAGWEVSAIDFSAAAVGAARAALGPWAERVQQADFFSFVPATPLQMIYERAFFCALPRRLWPALASHWAELLPAGGLLVGFFYFDQAPKGPPFGASPQQLGELLTPAFERIEDAPVADSLPLFRDKERWQVWRRR